MNRLAVHAFVVTAVCLGGMSMCDRMRWPMRCDVDCVDVRAAALVTITYTALPTRIRRIVVATPTARDLSQLRADYGSRYRIRLYAL